MLIIRGDDRRPGFDQMVLLGCFPVGAGYSGGFLIPCCAPIMWNLV